jgi:hypothetical protein
MLYQTTSLEIKGTSTPHSLCSIFTIFFSTVDCPADEGLHSTFCTLRVNRGGVGCPIEQGIGDIATTGNIGQFVILRYEKIFLLHGMREIDSEKIRQNFIVKSSPNLLGQEIRQKSGLSLVRVPSHQIRLV